MIGSGAVYCIASKLVRPNDLPQGTENGGGNNLTAAPSSPPPHCLIPSRGCVSITGFDRMMISEALIIRDKL
jgi:hypothetical protein